MKYDYLSVITLFLFQFWKGVSKFEYRLKLCELYECEHCNISVKFQQYKIKAHLKF